MARSLCGLLMLAVLAAAGCGQKPEARIEAPATIAGHGAERPAPPGESAHTIGAASAGEALEARVKTSLLSEAGLGAGGVDVEANAEGVVTLKGRVAAAEKQRQIEAAVLAVEGVRSVQNGLTVGQ
jgi:osmotically-inducible protein OsmY